MSRLRAGLCVFLLVATLLNNSVFAEPQSNITYCTSYKTTPDGYIATASSTSNTHILKENSSKRPNTILRRKKKLSSKKEHPRKKLLEEAPKHTQRAWLYSAIVPGLGQAYNKNYWRIPIIYGIFAGLAWGAIYNHMEYTTSRREYIEKYKDTQKRSYSNLGNFTEGRKRDRTIFIVAAIVWYLINVFDAYVGGTLKTFDVSDDLDIIIPLDKPKKDATIPPAVD